MNTSDPAFPCPRYVNVAGETISLSDKAGENGLSKRELFAAMAMQGLCASGLAKSIGRAAKDAKSSGARSGEKTKQIMAKIAVASADALLAALSAPRPSLPEESR